jgi:hypothetical protein
MLPSEVREANIAIAIQLQVEIAAQRKKNKGLAWE